MFSARARIGRRLAPALVLCLLAALLLDTAAAFAQSGPRKMTINNIESRTWPDITLNLTVTGPDGKAVNDIKPEQFQVSENGEPQNLTALELGPARSVPLALVMTIDVSGSMNADNKLTAAKAAAATFLSSIRPEDSAAVLAFNDRVIPVVPFTNDRTALQNGVNAMTANGNTAINDALYGSAQLISTAPKGKRRAIILLTDGIDTSSKYGTKAALDIAKQEGALVYAIGLGGDVNGPVLKALAESTGGKYYAAPSPTDLTGIYNAIGLELDSQVFLKYKSNTHVQRSYQVINVVVKYTAPDGQVLVRTISYRPPLAAVVGAETDPAVGGNTKLPVSTIQSPSEAGVDGEVPVAVPVQTETPFSVRIFSLGAAVLAGAGVLFAIAGLATMFTPSATSQRMAAYVTGATPTEEATQSPNFVRRVLVPASTAVGGRLALLSPKGYTDHVEQLLTLMGPPYKLQLGAFLGIQLAFSVLFVMVLGLWALLAEATSLSQWLLVLVLGVASGTYLPYFWLKRRVTKRRKALLKALPGALDFLAINVEAGLGFDAALTQVVHRWRNTLTDEFALMLIDFQIGKARKDAWRDLVQRTQVPELTTFVTAMLQNEQIGSSIGLLLRTQADQMRIRRRQAAEEAARTAPVKMLLPMVFFIFPGLFVVVLGPAVPQFLGSVSFLAGP